MALTHDGLRVEVNSKAIRQRPLDGRRLDWTVTTLACWTVGGIFLDGWAHEHGKVDTSFFTVWHALLYSGYLALTAVLVAALVLNQRAGYTWRMALYSDPESQDSLVSFFKEDYPFLFRTYFL